MVNVGGRSRGCSTCRRRRVKCDESRPLCRRCQRWNFDCDGPRGITFIHAESLTTSGHNARRTGSATSSSGSAVHLADSTPPPQRMVRVMGFDVCICYARSHLLRDGLIVSFIADVEPLDILRTQTPMAKRQVSHQALLSFAAILFGQQHQQVDIASRGYAMYSMALTQLNQTLADPTRYTTDETILAVATLAISECLVPSGKSLYLDHMMGLQGLIDLRDPSTFWPHKPYGFRNGVRFMVLFASLQLKKPCTLARAEWKSALRVGCSPEELREQDVYDVLADCTVLLAERESKGATWDLGITGALQQAREVEARSRVLHTQLWHWRGIWEDEQMSRRTSGSGVSPGVAITRNASDDHSMPSMAIRTTVLGNRELLELILFNVALATVLHIFSSLPCEAFHGTILPRSERGEQSAPESVKEYYASQERLAALEACRCVRYYIEGGQCLDASVPPILHWAIVTASRSLRYDMSAEGVWLRELRTLKGQHLVEKGLWNNYQWLDFP